MHIDELIRKINADSPGRDWNQWCQRLVWNVAYYVMASSSSRSVMGLLCPGPAPFPCLRGCYGRLPPTLEDASVTHRRAARTPCNELAARGTVDVPTFCPHSAHNLGTVQYH